LLHLDENVSGLVLFPTLKEIVFSGTQGFCDEPHRRMPEQ
jgi:hypothetical protein